jgi:dTMP kinase
MQGKLIVFEGGEGSGKTTQIQRLFEWLNKNKALETLRTQNQFAGIQLTREPGGSALGQHIRQLLLSDSTPKQAPIANTAELLLYAADRAQHVEETLVPWLQQGYWVLCDRYTDSTVAYQGYGRQLDLTVIHQLNQIATGGLKSDLTLWLNVAPAIGLARMHQRGQADRIEQASGEFHQRVSEGFAALAVNELTVEIDGDRPIEAVAHDIQYLIQQRIAQWYPSLSQI